MSKPGREGCPAEKISDWSANIINFEDDGETGWGAHPRWGATEWPSYTQGTTRLTSKQLLWIQHYIMLLPLIERSGAENDCLARYTTVLKPRFLYAAGVWWLRAQLKTVQSKLNRLRKPLFRGVNGPCPQRRWVSFSARSLAYSDYSRSGPNNGPPVNYTEYTETRNRTNVDELFNLARANVLDLN